MLKPLYVTHFDYVIQMETVTLNNGFKMPVIGLGTSTFRLASKDDVKSAVRAGLDAGYRQIDTAYIYKTEDAIGDVVQEFINAGKLRREELFIVTKLPAIHMDPKLVKRSLNMSLARLKTSYVDLYLIHFPMQFQYSGDDDEFFPTDEDGRYLVHMESDLIQTWKALEICVDEGLTRSIGVSNFNSEQMQRICDNARILPVTNQVECHVFLQQKLLHKNCKTLGVVLTAYAPLGSPGQPSKGPDDPMPLEYPLMKDLAKKHRKTVAHVLLRYLIQSGMVIIPKSVNPKRIQQNIEVFDFNLSEEDMDAISSINVTHRFFTFKQASRHPEYPFN